MDVINLSMVRYELLKCGGCGRDLGYVRIDVKVFPPKSWIRLVAGGPLVKIKKDALCEKCFKRLQGANKKATSALK